MSLKSWQTHLDPVSVKERAVDLWAVRLAQEQSLIDEVAAILSSDERLRASRFRFERDRRRFIWARGVLRCLLAEYLDADPEVLSFAYGARGKPALTGDHGRSLSFNLSHSHELTLIAIAPAHLDVGVDVELIRPMPDAEAIASRFFAPAEIAKWRTLPRYAQEVAFFHLWTRKEAYLKATGEGVTRHLASFEVTFTADEPVALRVPGDEQESARWILTAVTPAPGYAGALVTTREHPDGLRLGALRPIRSFFREPSLRTGSDQPDR